MNKAILSGELVAHVGDATTDGGIDVHQATMRTFEPWLQGAGREEYHPLVFFGDQAREARDIPEGSKVLLQASVRWAPNPCLHVHGLEVL